MKLSNGGVILDLGSHYFDLISFVTGSKPEIINNAYSEKKENEDSGFIDISYKDFSVSMILQRNQKLKRSIIICAGDRGSISADYISRKVIISSNHQINEIECPMSHDYEIIINNFVRAINNKEEITANAEAGIHSLKTSLAIYKVIKTGRSVRITTFGKPISR